MMRYDLHIVKTADFLRVDADGRFHLARAQEALTWLARTCIMRDVSSALIDLRHAGTDLSFTDLHALAVSLGEMGFRREHRLAILHPFNGKSAEFFALCASQRGWQVRAFVDFEEAMWWLGERVCVA
jgi:hypothetical protein